MVKEAELNVSYPLPTEMFSLKGKLLVATPAITSGIFYQSLVLLCSHDDQGALGFIVNRPLVSLSMRHLLEQFKLSGVGLEHQPVFNGGPIALERGFVLFSSPTIDYPDSVPITEQVSLTVSLDMLSTITQDLDPKHYIVVLGYAGWEPNQLEQEIADHSWLLLDLESDLLFDCPVSQQWTKAMEKLGISAPHLLISPGNA